MATQIKLRLDGPYRVSGAARLLDAAGRPIALDDRSEAGEPIALCRCGHSQTKPFCDGSHRALGAWAQAPATLPGPPRSPAPSA